ncbi:MAG: polysaccharide biosynthesis/export family protein [Candidatus Latescibacterota bacterium]
MPATRWVCAAAGLALAALWACASAPRPAPRAAGPATAERTPAEQAPPEPFPADPAKRAFVEVDGKVEYLVGAGDILTVTLRGVELATERVTVRPDGNISFSLAEDVPAAGLTAAQVDSALTAEVGRFVRLPKVDVEVTEYRSKMVSVLGAMQTVITAGTKTGQGRYPLTGRATVLDMILLAGGTTPDAQLDRVQLVRGTGSYTLNLREVLDTGSLRYNPVLQGDDIVIIPGAAHLSKKVIVLGEVASPDVYLVAGDANLAEALSKAGGLSSNALRDDIRIIRPGADGPRMLTADFGRLTGLADLRQNVALENNDIVYVPRSFLGDVNQVLAKVEPLLEALLLPATFRDLYTTGGGLRMDTGEPPSGATGFTRPLPGTKPAVEEDEPGGK